MDKEILQKILKEIIRKMASDEHIKYTHKHGDKKYGDEKEWKKYLRGINAIHKEYKAIEDLINKL